MARFEVPIDLSALPAKRGSYLLELALDRAITLRPGKLGEVRLGPGRLRYYGSARGPGGLRARLTRHLEGGRKRYWHIDWLLAEAPVRAVEVDLEASECDLVRRDLDSRRWASAAARFGAADCRSCPAHLLARYEQDDAVPEVEEYRRLRVLCGLSPKTREAARIGLGNSLFATSIRLGVRLIATGRVVGDGGCFFEVVDIAVDPDHQRKGLGVRVMQAIMAYLEREAPASAHVSLLADGGAPALYEKFGFRPTAPASIAMALRVDSNRSD